MALDDPLLWNNEPVEDDEFFDRLIEYFDLKPCPFCDAHVADCAMQEHIDKHDA